MSNVVVFDIDGVFASFESGFGPVLKDVSGRDLVEPNYEPQVWDWPQDLGYTEEEVAAAWKRVRSRYDFWLMLDEFADNMESLRRRIKVLQDKNDVYFLTTRSGVDAKTQTELWLGSRLQIYPTVILSNDKGPVVKGMRATTFLDDKFENAMGVAEASPSTRVYLLNRPYNLTQTYRQINLPDNVTRIKTVEEFFQIEGVNLGVE